MLRNVTVVVATAAAAVRKRIVDTGCDLGPSTAQARSNRFGRSWTPVDKLAHLKDALTGDAGQILWDTYTSATDTVEKLVALLKNRYSGTRQIDKYRMELRLRRRQLGETLSALQRDIRRLMALAHPSLPEEARDTIATDYYIDGLDDPDFALKIRERNPVSLDDALRISLQLEAWERDSKRN